jgi:hypothetical protein
MTRPRPRQSPLPLAGGGGSANLDSQKDKAAPSPESFRSRRPATHTFPTIARTYQSTVTVSRIIFLFVPCSSDVGTTTKSSRQAGPLPSRN